MTNLIKYPKTMHLPWSPGLQNDDRLIQSLAGLEGRRVIVTEKFDGENATLYSDHYHARSLDSKHHPSRDWIKAFHGGIRYLIPDGYRICGENMFARHSIGYDSLPDYFLGFSIWNEQNECLSWDDTLYMFGQLGITPVNVLYDGPWEWFVKRLYMFETLVQEGGKEGYVVRIAGSFKFEDFQKYVAKYVRKNHIQTDDHWMNGPVFPNRLRV